MIWPFSKNKAQRDERVTSLDQEARANEIALVEKVLEVDRKRVRLDQITQLAEDALRDIGGGHRA